MDRLLSNALTNRDQRRVASSRSPNAAVDFNWMVFFEEGALLAAGLILEPAAFALRGATPLDWIAAVSGVGIGAALTLLFNGNKEKNPASV